MEAKLAENKKVRFLYCLGEDFEGFEAGAMWNDAAWAFHAHIDLALWHAQGTLHALRHDRAGWQPCQRLLDDTH